MEPNTATPQQNNPPVKEKKKPRGKVIAILFVVAVLLLSNVFFGILYKQTLDLKTELDSAVTELNTRNGFLNGQLQKIRKESGNTHTRVGVCNKDSCLYKSTSSLEGFARVSGNYTTRTAIIEEETEVECSAIQVSFGNNELLNELRGMAAGGSEAVTLDQNSDIVMNIDLDKLTEADKTLLTSTEEVDIGFSIIRKDRLDKDRFGCVNVIDVISITR